MLIAIILYRSTNLENKYSHPVILLLSIDISYSSISIYVHVSVLMQLRVIFKSLNTTNMHRYQFHCKYFFHITQSPSSQVLTLIYLNIYVCVVCAFVCLGGCMLVHVFVYVCLWVFGWISATVSVSVSMWWWECVCMSESELCPLVILVTRMTFGNVFSLIW